MRTRPIVRGFVVPKQGNSADENEDCFSSRHKRNVLLSLSDGATESALAGVWAEQLVNSGWKTALLDVGATGDTVIPETLVSTWLTPLRDAFWEKYVNRELPWYAREKVRRGAQATFLAFRMSRKGAWSGVSCGDTCLLTVRDGHIEDSVPLRSSDEFGSQPSLISSHPQAPIPLMSVHHGVCNGRDDVFVLATDALASWLLAETTSNARIRRLLDCESQEEFEAFVAEERKRLNLKNDDTTALILRSRPQVR